MRAWEAIRPGSGGEEEGLKLDFEAVVLFGRNVDSRQMDLLVGAGGGEKQFSLFHKFCGAM